MNLNALAVVKFVASGVVGIGTGKIVGKIIKNNVTPETLIDKVTVLAAGWVIAGIATNATKKYTDDMVDDVVKAATVVVDKVKTDNKLNRINRFESTFEKEGLDPSKFKRNDSDKWVPIKDTDTKPTEAFREEDRPIGVDNPADS